MKKNPTFYRKRLQYFCTLLTIIVINVLFSTESVAQINVNYDFNSNLQGWSTNWTQTAILPCNIGSARKNIFTIGTQGAFVSPLLGTATGSLLFLNFSYKIINYSAPNAATPATFGSIDVEYASSTAGPWINIGTINSNNHIPSTSCEEISYSFVPPSGDLYIRFNCTYGTGDYYIYFDDIAVMPACSAPPLAGTITASPDSNLCPHNVVNLNVTGNSSGGGQSYQWQTSTDGNTWVNIPGATSLSTSVSGLTSDTYYRFKTICSGDTTYSNAILTTVSSDCPANSTYSAGKIATEYNTAPTTSTNSSCPGTLSVSIPPNVLIDSVSVSYRMTASAFAYMSEQRSYVKCINPGGNSEPNIYFGAGAQAGTYSYSRTGLDIANNVLGGGNIDFEVHAFRTWGGSGCDTTTGYNVIDNNSFTVLVYYSTPPPRDITPLKVISPSSQTCYTANENLTVRIGNRGSNSLDFSVDPFTIHYEVTGPVNQSGSLTISSGQVSSMNHIDLLVTSNLDLSGDGTYQIRIWTSAPWDQKYSNDTLGTFTIVTPGINASALPPVLTSPTATTTLFPTSPYFPSGRVLFSEIIHYKDPITGTPSGGWGAYPWILDDDNLEVNGVAYSSLAGFTIETWNSNAVNAERVYTFPANAVLNANGTAYLGWGGPVGGSVDSTNNYYRAGFASDSYGSATVKGYILRDSSGNISDVVVYGTPFTWNVASGVTTSDWAGNMTTTGSGTSGIRRIGPTDTNGPADWVISSSSNPQDPNILNPGVHPIVPTQLSGISWSYMGSVIDTTVSVQVGPFISSGSYPYLVNYTSICKTHSDTVYVIVNLTNANLSSISPSCNGLTDGTVSAISTGGDAPYSYLWNTNDTTSTITNVGSGKYFVTITDNNQVSATDTIIITEPDPLSVNFSEIPVYCHTSPGALTVLPSGGTPGYSFQWSNNQTNQTATNLPAGSYSVTITDTNNCTDTFTGTVSLYLLNADLTTSNVSCKGENDGEAIVSVSGGLSPYNISWSNNQTGSIATGLDAGTHTVTVSDSSGCEIIQNIQITEPSELITSLWNAKNPSCFDGDDGEIIVSASGGTPPYEYSLLGPQNNGVFSGLEAKSYTISVTDYNGCQTSLSTSLTQPDKIDTSVIMVNDVTLKASLEGALYQWVNCIDGNSPIPGETGQSLTAPYNGSFAVKISYKGCIEYSPCYGINSVGISNLDFSQSNLKVYPNPNNGRFIIETDKEGDFTLINGIGQTVQKIKVSAENNFKAEITGISTGVYYLIGMENDIPVQRKIMVTK